MTKILHRKLKIEQQQKPPANNRGRTQVNLKRTHFLLH